MDTNFDLNMLNATFQYIFLYSCLPFNNAYNFTCPSLRKFQVKSSETADFAIVYLSCDIL